MTYFLFRHDYQALVTIGMGHILSILNVEQLSYIGVTKVLLILGSPDALSQQTARSPAHPENSPGHMWVFVTGGAEGEPERAQKVKSLCKVSVISI